MYSVLQGALGRTLGIILSLTQEHFELNHVDQGDIKSERGDGLCGYSTRFISRSDGSYLMLSYFSKGGSVSEDFDIIFSMHASGGEKLVSRPWSLDSARSLLSSCCSKLQAPALDCGAILKVFKETLFSKLITEFDDYKVEHVKMVQKVKSISALLYQVQSMAEDARCTLVDLKSSYLKDADVNALEDEIKALQILMDSLVSKRKALPVSMAIQKLEQSLVDFTQKKKELDEALLQALDESKGTLAYHCLRGNV